VDIPSVASLFAFIILILQLNLLTYLVLMLDLGDLYKKN